MCAASECAVKSKVRTIKSFITIAPNCTRKNITSLLLLALLLVLCTRNNIDSNKLVIFSSLDLYYGDTYIVLVEMCPVQWVTLHNIYACFFQMWFIDCSCIQY